MQSDKTKKDADSFTGSFHIPADEEDWEDLVAAGKLKDYAINTLPKMRSASIPYKKQFIMLKVLWPSILNYSDFEELLSDYGLEAFMEEAEQIVAASPEAQKYLALISEPYRQNNLDERSPDWAGSFMPLLKLQKKCAEKAHSNAPYSLNIQTRGRNSFQNPFQEDRRAVDENLVNAALILFLEAINGLIPDSKVETTFQRVGFNAIFEMARYEANTDGALQKKVGKIIHSILEVKKHRRQVDMQSIQMQESAEISAWILENENQGCLFNNQKLMISQDADGVYLLFAEMGPGYLDYLKNKPEVNTPSFLSIQTFGPWVVTVPEHIDRLVVIVCAIMLAAGQAVS